VIKSVRFEHFKSLDDVALPLGPVNILIGMNAAGKSNVIDGLRVLSEAVQSDVETTVSRRGGVNSVVFRGSRSKTFAIEITYIVPDPSAPHSSSDMAYRVEVGDHEGSPAVLEELLRLKRKRNEPGRAKIWLSARLGEGRAVRDAETLEREAFQTGDTGVLALKALGFLATFPRIRALRAFVEEWQFLSVNLDAIRAPQRDVRAETLRPDAGNLANVLRTIRGTDVYVDIMEDLAHLLGTVEGVETDVDRGRVLLLLRERPFPDPFEAIAASDGTLRLLALLTAVHLMPRHGLLCVEEPEHGLHPLVFGPLLDLIRERCPAGETRQTIITTHSPDLVDAAEPDEIVTVERNSRGTTELARLDPQQLRQWLIDFRLGELWRMRQIAGATN